MNKFIKCKTRFKNASIMGYSFFEGHLKHGIYIFYDNLNQQLNIFALWLINNDFDPKPKSFILSKYINYVAWSSVATMQIAVF